MPLVTEVGLGLRHIVFDRDPAAPRKGAQHPPHGKRHSSSPLFGPCSLLPNGWMYQDANWYGGSVNIVLNGDLSLPRKGAQNPYFSAHGVYILLSETLHRACWQILILPSPRRLFFRRFSVCLTVSNFAQKLPNGFT